MTGKIVTISDVDQKLDKLFISTNRFLNNNYTFKTEDFIGNVVLAVESVDKVTLTVPADLTAHQPVVVVRYGTGVVEIVPGGGVTLNHSGGGTKIISQYDVASVLPMRRNAFLLTGALEPTT